MRWFVPFVLAGCGRFGFDGSTSDTSVDAIDLERGLIAHWPLHDGAGMIAVDVTGHGHDGRLGDGSSAQTVPTWSVGAGHAGGVALHFDGINDAVQIAADPVALKFSSSFTITAWAKWDSFNAGNVDEIIFGRSGSAHGYVLKGSHDSGRETINLAVGDALAPSIGINRCGGTTLATGTWYHVAGVYDASIPDLRVYLNGIDDTTTPLCSAVTTIPVTLNVPGPADNVLYPQAGAGGSGGGAWFPGFLEEVRVYDRALDAETLALLTQ